MTANLAHEIAASVAPRYPRVVTEPPQEIPGISLRETTLGDIAVFFAQEQDNAARRVTAFTSKRPTERGDYEAWWKKLLADKTINVKTVMLGDEVIGYVAAFERNVEQREVAYWIGREFWGRNFATQALQLFLEEFTERPLYARCAMDHRASMRVLEKCGFVTYDRGRFFAEAHGKEMDEWIFELK